MKQLYFHTVVPSPFMGGHGRQSFCCLLIRHEIAFDINYFTYKAARITFAQVENADRKEVVIPKSNTDWLDRHITSAVSKVRARISFACPRTSSMSCDEILESPHQFCVDISIDREWDGNPQTLCDAIHDFVVKQCIADWSQFALPSQFSYLQADADSALEAIHDIACSFTMPVEQNPFLGK